MYQLLLNSYESDAAIGGAEAEAPDGRVILAWGKMEARLNNDWAMRKAFASGLKLLPNNTHIPHAWAIEELKMGNVDSARKLFRYALECDASDGLVYQSYALLEQQHGRPEVYNICIHAYMHTCIHAYMHTYIHAYIRAMPSSSSSTAGPRYIIYIYMHTYMGMCIHNYMHAYFHTYTYISIYI